MDFDHWEERLAKVSVDFRMINRNRFTVFHYYKNGKQLATILPDQSIVVHNKKLLEINKGKKVDRYAIESAAGAKEAITDEVEYQKAWFEVASFNTKLNQEKNEFRNEFIWAVFRDLGIPATYPKSGRILDEALEHCAYTELRKFHKEVKKAAAKLM